MSIACDFTGSGPLRPDVLKLGLRDYQRADLDAITSKPGRNVLYVAPTGSGKTRVLVRAIKRYVARGERVLVLVHRSSILEQTWDELVREGLEVGVTWRDDQRRNASCPVQLASIDTFVRREDWPPVDRIVIDEAHHAASPKFLRVLRAYDGIPRLGATATPCRLDGKPLRDIFDEMHVSLDVASLIGLGFLSEPEVWTWETGVDLSDVRVQTKRGTETAGNRLTGPVIVGSIVDHWRRHADGLMTVCYATSKKTGGRIGSAFKAAGVPHEYMFGETVEDERKAIVARLKTRQTLVVITCDVISEGWDLPELGCVIDAAPTASLRLWLQRCGRALRPKVHAPIILDHAGNAVRLQCVPQSPMAWSLDDKARAVSTAGVRVLADGRVEPVFVDGELVPADGAVRSPCAVCGEPATAASTRNAKRGTRAYCEKHPRGVLISPCVVCGSPTSAVRSRRARKDGVNAYCSTHSGVARALLLLPCHVCGEPSTRASSGHARRSNCRPHCEKHGRGFQDAKPLPCAVCGGPATKTSSRNARTRPGLKAYCHDHRCGRRFDRATCAVCGAAATAASSHRARRDGAKAYCATHSGSPEVRTASALQTWATRRRNKVAPS